MSSRSRFRSRMFTSNLGMVENNYKEAMARLEKSRRPSSADRETKVTRASPFTSRFDFNGDEIDTELQAARSRASKVIHEKSVIDTSAESMRSRSLVPVPVTSAMLENDFDEQVGYRRFLLRRSDVNLNNSVIYVIPLPSDSHYIPRPYYDYYNYYYNYYDGCNCGCS